MHFTMKDEILKRFLTADGEPISGQVLADELNVSRTAIWKHMQTLKQEGYEFETVKNVAINCCLYRIRWIWVNCSNF